MRKSEVVRFLSKIRRDPSGCWLWMGTKHPANQGKIYGAFHLRGKNWLAHRAAYTLLKGKIPNGFVVHHECEVTLCVNPTHLKACTQHHNVIEKGSSPLAKNAKKKECKRGHPLSGTNLILSKRKYGMGRECKKCRTLRRKGAV